MNLNMKELFLLIFFEWMCLNVYTNLSIMNVLHAVSFSIMFVNITVSITKNVSKIINFFTKKKMFVFVK